MKPLSDALLLEWATDSNGPVRFTVVAEKCNDCGQRIHYYNSDPVGNEDDGNASCGCTIEGPEACSRLEIGPQLLRLLSVALVQVGIDGRKRDAEGTPIGDLRKTLEYMFAQRLYMPRKDNLVAHELAEAAMATLDAWRGAQVLDTADDSPIAQRVYEKIRLLSLELEHQQSKTLLRTLHTVLSTPLGIPRDELLKLVDMGLKTVEQIDDMAKMAETISKDPTGSVAPE